MSQQRIYFLKVAAFALVYFLAARVGFLFPFAGELPTLIWLASGVALVVLLLYGLDLWPGIALGSVLVAISNHHSLPLTIGIVFTHTIEPFIGAYILRKYTTFDTRLEKFTDVRYLFTYCILLAPAIGAIFGVLSFAISPEGSNKNLPIMAWQWWIAHAISFSAILPLCLTWLSERPKIALNSRFLEFLFALGSLTLVSVLVFVHIDMLPIGNFPLGHVVFPFLLWIALRFSPREVALSGFIVVFLSIIGTLEQTGPFSRPNLDFNLVLLGTFVFSVALMMLMLSSIIAQRQHTRNQLQQSHKALEERVLERTNELNIANQNLLNEVEERKKIGEALADARDKAVMALNHKNQILANVSHDARTPLNIIMLNTELMRRQQDNLTDRQMKRLQIIDASGQDLLNFINNLLDAANLQTNQVTPEYVPINLREYFDKNLSKYRELASDKDIDLQLEIADSVPDEIVSDVEYLNKILANLITNAIKFTQKGSITIAVSANDSDCWRLSVCDTGIGISEEDLQNIFQPFWQVDGSSSRQTNRGVGLGLSIVEQFVRALDGTISVQSTFGQGTIFSLEFPLTVNEASHARTERTTIDYRR